MPKLEIFKEENYKQIGDSLKQTAKADNQETGSERYKKGKEQ